MTDRLGIEILQGDNARLRDELLRLSELGKRCNQLRRDGIDRIAFLEAENAKLRVDLAVARIANPIASLFGSSRAG